VRSCQSRYFWYFALRKVTIFVQQELAYSVIIMRLVQTEKLLEWLAGTAPADSDALVSALGAVRDALATVQHLQPVTS